MDKDKIFDALRNCITEPKCKDCPWETCEKLDIPRVRIPVDLGLAIIRLLKEQEEREPIFKTDNGIYTFGACAKCGKHFGLDKPKYCSDCGQAVKWD